MCVDWHLREFLSSEQQWEWVPAIILPSNLLNLHTVISQEIVNCEKIRSALQSIVFP